MRGGAAAVSEAARGIWLAGGCRIVEPETGASPLKIEGESTAGAGEQRVHKGGVGGDATKSGQQAAGASVCSYGRRACR
jgi:hypothetical protein